MGPIGLFSAYLNKLAPQSHKIASTAKPVGDKEQLKKLSGAMWECVAIRAAEGGGYLRTYRANPDFFFKNGDAASFAYDKIFPAVEPTLDMIPETFPQRQNPNDPKSSVAHTSQALILKDLGFSFWYVDKYKNSCHIELPDREALLASWPKVQAKYGIRNELSIVPGQGKEGNLAFVQALRDHLCLLSHDKEFVHDMFFHIIPAIVSCSSTPAQFQEYLANRNNNIDEILTPLKEIIFLKSWYGDKVDSLPPRIQNLLPKIPALEAMLGIYVDGEASRSNEFLSFDEEYEYVPGVEESDALYYSNVLQNILKPEPGKSLAQQFVSLKKELMDAFPEIQKATLKIHKSAPIHC